MCILILCLYSVLQFGVYVRQEEKVTGKKRGGWVWGGPHQLSNYAKTVSSVNFIIQVCARADVVIGVSRE